MKQSEKVFHSRLSPLSLDFRLLTLTSDAGTWISTSREQNEDFFASATDDVESVFTEWSSSWLHTHSLDDSFCAHSNEIALSQNPGTNLVKHFISIFQFSIRRSEEELKASLNAENYRMCTLFLLCSFSSHLISLHISLTHRRTTTVKWKTFSFTRLGSLWFSAHSSMLFMITIISFLLFCVWNEAGTIYEVTESSTVGRDRVGKPSGIVIHSFQCKKELLFSQRCWLNVDDGDDAHHSLNSDAKR